MLVLSRKVSEQIVVPESGLVVTVLEIRGDRVRLGITAPTRVEIFRQEVWARIQAGLAAKEGTQEPATAVPGPQPMPAIVGQTA